MKSSIKFFNIIIYAVAAMLIYCIDCLGIINNMFLTQSIFFILFILLWMFLNRAVFRPIDIMTKFADDHSIIMPKFIFSELNNLREKIFNAFVDLEALTANLKTIVAQKTEKYEKVNTLLKTVLDNMHDAVIIHDKNGKIIDINETALAMYDISSKEEFCRYDVVQLSSHNNPFEKLASIWDGVLNGEEAYFEWEAKKLNGITFFVEVFLTKVDLNGDILILANVSDISIRKKSELLIKSIIDLQENIVFLATKERFLISNENFLKFFCFTDIEDANRHFSCIKGIFSDERLSCEEVQCRFKRHMERIDNKMTVSYDGGGKTVFLVSTKTVTVNEEQYIVSLTDITSIETEKELLEIKSNIDHLTSLKNRMAFDKILEIELNKTKTSGEPLSIIILDVDKFKDINDTYGHQIGDEALKLLAKLLMEHTRKSDTVARYGGEEFVIIAPRTTVESAYGLAEKIRQIIDFTYINEIPHFTCSFGIASFDIGENQANFIKKADNALYAAKNSGRNRSNIYEHI